MTIGANVATESTFPASAYSITRTYSRAARSDGVMLPISGGAPPACPAKGAFGAPSFDAIGARALGDVALASRPAMTAMTTNNATAATPHGSKAGSGNRFTGADAASIIAPAPNGVRHR